MRAIHLILIGFTLILLSSCSSTKISDSPPYTGKGYPGHYKVGTPYKIENTWYYPKKESTYDEEGMASWYGPGFHGRRTANGDYFNRESLSAAHRTLPLPSMVRITNVENGRSVMAMVNDRGPFSKSRIIDVSERVADLIGIKQQGTGRVRVQFLPTQTKQLLEKLSLQEKGGTPEKDNAAKHINDAKDANAKTETQASPVKDSYSEGATHFMKKEKEIFIQAGAYTLKENAAHVAAKLSQFGSVNIMPITIGNASLYRVRLGPINNSANANTILAEIIKGGTANAIIVGKNS